MTIARVAVATVGVGVLLATLNGCAAQTPDFNGMTDRHAEYEAGKIDNVVSEDFSTKILGLPITRYQKGAPGGSEWTVAASGHLINKYGHAVYLGVIPSVDVTEAISREIAHHDFDYLLKAQTPSK